MSKLPKYQEQVVNDALSHLSQHGINPVKTDYGWNVTFSRIIPMPGRGRDQRESKTERFTDVDIVEMAENKGFKVPRGGSNWNE